MPNAQRASHCQDESDPVAVQCPGTPTRSVGSPTSGRVSQSRHNERIVG